MSSVTVCDLSTNKREIISFNYYSAEKKKTLFVVQDLKFWWKKSLSNDIQKWTCATYKSYKNYLKIVKIGTCVQIFKY